MKKLKKEGYTRSLIEVHVAVFLFSFAALFGKLISLHPIIIALGRVFFGAIFLLLMFKFLKQKIKLNRNKDLFWFIILGIILALHWFSLYKSVQISTVAIALLTYSTFPIFVTFLEPFYFKEKLRIFDIFTALICFIGVLLIIPKFEINNYITQGVLWGLLTAFTFAILSIINRKYVQKYSSSVINFYEFSVAAIVLLPGLFFIKPHFTLENVLLLVLLGVVFTGIAHTLFVRGMKKIKVHLVSIISMLEILYGIILAVIIIGEIPNLRIVLGGIIILIAIFLATKKSRKVLKKYKIN